MTMSRAHVSASAYLHELQHQHSLVTPKTCAVELDHITVIADRLQDVYLLQQMSHLCLGTLQAVWEPRAA